MFIHNLRDTTLSKRTLFNWFLLTFLAGNVNAGGFLACGRFVSHVTGFATLAGVDWAQGHYASGVGMTAVPMFFLSGVMFSAYVVHRRNHRGKKYGYSIVMALVTLCLALVTVGGVRDWFSTFGGMSLYMKRDFWLLSLLCMASGLQNAAISTSSGYTVRTTHLTGVTTDFGIGIMRLLDLKRGTEQYAFEMKANILRAGTIFSFMLGSFLGALLFLKVSYFGFALPTALAIYATVVSLFEQA